MTSSLYSQQKRPVSSALPAKSRRHTQQLSKAKIFTKLDANCSVLEIVFVCLWYLVYCICVSYSRALVHAYGWVGCLSKDTPNGKQTTDYESTHQMELFGSYLATSNYSARSMMSMYGKDQDEHNRRVTVALKRIQAAGVTLSSDKFDFGKTSLKFLGHVVASMLIQTRPR